MIESLVTVTLSTCGDGGADSKSELTSEAGPGVGAGGKTGAAWWPDDVAEFPDCGVAAGRSTAISKVPWSTTVVAGGGVPGLAAASLPLSGDSAASDVFDTSGVEWAAGCGGAALS
jgi:hypothetical protein